MTDLSKRPLITFAIFAYNQERFIQEAVEGAFSQTYEPLEIILSDDGSNDHTFDIMSKMAKEYYGPHTIILNRNDVNQGLVQHINKMIFELSHGELIVPAAGDDVSLPSRVEMLYKLWDDNNREFYLMHSAGYSMSTDGKDLGVFHAVHEISDIVEYLDAERVVPGATSAWHRKIFEIFGRINKGVILEDAVIGFRGLLMGSIGYVDIPLVRYRLGFGITSRLRTPDDWGAWDLLNQHKKDLIKINYKNMNIENAFKRRELKIEYRTALLVEKSSRIRKSVKAIIGGVPAGIVLRDFIRFGCPILQTIIRKIKNLLFVKIAEGLDFFKMITLS